MLAVKNTDGLGVLWTVGGGDVVVVIVGNVNANGGCTVVEEISKSLNPYGFDVVVNNV